MSDAGRPTVVLAGNPNAGKTTLFNALTGARARTGNYPGVTVERRVGRVELEAADGAPRAIDLVDLPGTYSLSARSPEEQVAVDALVPIAGPTPDAVVVVCDASALERHLYFAIQILETGVPVVLALNMMDDARAAGVDVDVAHVAREVGAEAVPIVARTGEGLAELRAALSRALSGSRTGKAGGDAAPLGLELPPASASDVARVEAAVDPMLRAGMDPARRAALRRARALWAILSIGDDELVGVPAALRESVARVRATAEAEGRSLDRDIIGARYARIDAIAAAAIRRAPAARGPSATDRIDAVLTHPIAGLVAFVLVMGILFQALFTWSEPAMTGIELAIAWAQGAVRGVLPDGPLRDLLVEGVIAGVGNVIVFVPQIALLSLFIAALEDWGYLARVAFVIDRMMNGVGLHGRAFVPLLSGFACAVPAVMATRTIESRKDRLVTMLALPLMSCSARLPIYTLMIAVAFPITGATLPGGISVGAVALLAMYALSVVATLSAAAVLRRTVLPGPSPALVLELPPYRAPVLRNLLLTTWQRTRSFLVDAGTIILAITIVLWGLLSYPRHDDVESRFETQRTEARAELDGAPLEERLAAIDADNAAERMEHSVAGSFGRAIEPAIEPLGFDWKIGVGLVASFAAREVLVSTLGIVYGVGEADEVDEGLRAELRAARTPGGERVFTPLVGVSLMVFFVLAAQCMSTLAIVRRESGSWKWPILMVVYMNTLAYLASLAVFQIGRALGFT